MTVLLEYHKLALHIWPQQARPRVARNNTTLHKTPIFKNGTRHIARLASLRNACKHQIKRNTLIDMANGILPTLNARFQQMLRSQQPINLLEVPRKCNKVLSSIIRKAHLRLPDKLRAKEDTQHTKSPKRYRTILKVSSGLLSRAQEQPRLSHMRDANKGMLILDPETDNTAVSDYFVTPDVLPDPP